MSNHIQVVGGINLNHFDDDDDEDHDDDDDAADVVEAVDDKRSTAIQHPKNRLLSRLSEIKQL